MKKIIILFNLLSASIIYSQVGINTENPREIFHIDGKKDNPKTGIPTAQQQQNDLVVTSEGNLGIGTNTPDTELVIRQKSENKEGFIILTPNNTQFPNTNRKAISTGTWLGGSGFLRIYNNNDALPEIQLSAIPSPSGTTNSFIQGSLGVGTTSPTNRLHISAPDDPLRVSGISEGSNENDKILAVTSTGVIKNLGTLSSLSIPTPTVFRLENSITNFLSNATIGNSQLVPMSMIKNSIPNLVYNPAQSTITFPPGTYQISFVYEAVHNAANCTISSYFIDFPGDARVHSTASHISGPLSIHGGNVNYTTIIENNSTWSIRLGRGQSGNCTAGGMTLVQRSTQLVIFRLGD